MDSPADHPDTVPPPWRIRVPELSDLDDLVALRIADQLPWTGSTRVDRDGIESEIAGIASWTRRQVVLVGPDDVARAWITVHDRAAGRSLIWGYLDRTLPDLDAIAAGLYAWAEDQAVEFARLRGLAATRLDESPFEADVDQSRWLQTAGYVKRRTWLHMSRPVAPDEQVPGLREGVVVRPVDRHDNDLPVAADLQIVHQMLEESFEDHFNSYRESFPEFVQRLREDPGHRWDHWWIAEVDGRPAGALVCSVLAANAAGREGSYVEYIGVDRRARGRGVAKGLLFTVIRDAAERGRDRVALEVDDDSPTSADQLYRSMGWETEYVTDSWFKDIELPSQVTDSAI